MTKIERAKRSKVIERYQRVFELLPNTLIKQLANDVANGKLYGLIELETICNSQTN